MKTDGFRPVRTVSEGPSIWKDLEEDEFRKHLVTLEEQSNAVPVDVQIFDINEDANASVECALPVKIEQRIADDFAFLAAVQEGAQSVAAVCLEQHFTPAQQLKLQIAAIDTLDVTVKTTLDGICNILMHVNTLSDPVDQLFELIVGQHQSRILARLRSKKWTKPRYLAESHKKPLWQDFPNLIHRVQHIYPRRGEKTIRQQVEQGLAALASVYEDFESCRDEDVQKSMMELMYKTYTLCREPHVRDFAMKIQQARPTAQIGAAVKSLHQLEKIGAYFRIARDLTGHATKYPHWFGNIVLEYLVPYASIPTEIAYESWAMTCHVHAEVQLIVHYDLLKESDRPDEKDQLMIWPRTIGTSKYLCFLCYLFIKHHNQFFAANTHGRLYDQWTVPDLEEYTVGLRGRYADVLRKMDEEILALSSVYGPTRQWRAEPMTSRQNLLSDDL